MRTAFFSALAIGLLVASTGCAPTPRVGNGITATERVFGDYGITGHNNNLTVVRGSKITKLSIIGDNNTINVEDGVTLYRIEFWGKNNTVIVPDTQFIYRTTEVGANQIIRRPHQPLPGEEYPTATPATPTPTEPAPATSMERKPAPRVSAKPLPPEADMVDEPAPSDGEEK